MVVFPQGGAREERRSLDSVAEVWGERTPFEGEGRWPVRVDELVTLELDRSGGNRRAKAARDQGLERFRIARVAVREPDGSEGRSIGKDRLVLRFKTLNSNVLEANDYWLDTGSVLV